MAITVVASVTKAGAASGGTTTAIDTTGATLLVVSVGWFSTNPITVTDSKGNTWVPLTRAIASTTQTQLFFCLTPTVGSGHTFTVSGTTIYPAILVAAFAGVVSVQIDTGATSTASPCTAGPVTPLQSGALVVTSRAGNAASTDSVTPGGFTLLSVAYGAGTTMRGGLGYVIQTTAAAITPTWTWTGSPSENASTTAVFLPGAAPAPALVRVQRTPAVATTTAATTSVLTFATPPTVGHAIVVVATGNHATTLVTAVTDNYGNTYSLAKAQGNASGPRGVAVWFCQAITATGASFTVTVTGTSVQRLGVAIEISGVGVGLVLDQTAGTGAVGAASTTTGATAALTGNDHLVVAGAGIAATLASLTMTMASPHWTQEGEALTSTQSSELDSGVVIGAAGMTLRAAWSWPSGGAHAASAIVAFSPGAPVDVTVPDVVGGDRSGGRHAARRRRSGDRDGDHGGVGDRGRRPGDQPVADGRLRGRARIGRRSGDLVGAGGVEGLHRGRRPDGARRSVRRLHAAQRPRPRDGDGRGPPPRALRRSAGLCGRRGDAALRRRDPAAPVHGEKSVRTPRGRRRSSAATG